MGLSSAGHTSLTDFPCQAMSIGAKPRRGWPGMLRNDACWPTKMSTLRSKWQALHVLPGVSTILEKAEGARSSTAFCARLVVGPRAKEETHKAKR
jgi:hypothetical protein